MTKTQFEIKDGEAIIPEGTKLIDMWEFCNCAQLKKLVVLTPSRESRLLPFGIAVI